MRGGGGSGKGRGGRAAHKDTLEARGCDVVLVCVHVGGQSGDAIRICRGADVCEVEVAGGVGRRKGP